MLKVFRDNLKYLSWVLWLVIAVFVLFIFVDFGSIRLAGGPAAAGDSAAVVGGDEVPYREFERAYKQVEEQYRQAYGEQFSSELAKQIGLPMQVLNQLVDERILLQEAKRMGLEVTDEELRRSILDLPVLQQDGKFIGEQAYVALLRRNGMRPDDFESSQRQALLTRKVQAVLADTVYVAPAEVEAAYREEAETATVRLLRLPAQRFAAEVTVDEDGLAAYFAEHQEDFRLSERRVVDYLLVDAVELRATIVVPDADVRAYYDAHADEFTTEEQVKARHILLRTGADRSVEEAKREIEAIKARIAAGEDFAALAAELSEDPGSKTRGGDLGFFARGAMVKPFENAAFGAELGDVVGPVDSSFGVHLIQVQARRPGGRQPFDEAEEGIRARLAGERADGEAEAKAKALAEKVARDTPDTAGLETLAGAEAGTTSATTPPFGRGDNVPGIGRGTEFTTRAFDLTVGAASEPVHVSRGWAVLVVREVQEPRLPELGEVRQQVVAAYREQRQRELARAALVEARAAIDGGASIDAVAEGLDVTLEDAGPFGAKGALGTLGTAPEVARQALGLEVGAISEPLLHGDDALLFEVTDRTHFDLVMFASERSEVKDRLQNQRFGELLRGLLTQRREELGVTYDPRVLQTFGAEAQDAS
jgi:peptidyl-prolyl cis-trans isomerase D